MESSVSAGEKATAAKENKVGQERSGKTSRVKKVPDFNKLHNKWQRKIEKVERREKKGG